MVYSEMSNERKNKICKSIEYNVAQEAMARDYYYELLDLIGNEHKEIIRGIIDDELNHSIILMRLCEIYSKNVPSEFESLINLKKKE